MLIIILLIVILLHFSVSIYVKGGTKTKKVEIKVKYLGLTLYPRKPKKPRKKRRWPWQRKKENQQQQEDQQLDEMLQEIEEEAAETDGPDGIADEKEEVHLSGSSESAGDNEESAAHSVSENALSAEDISEPAQEESSAADVKEKEEKKEKKRPRKKKKGDKPARADSEDKKGGLGSKIEGLKEKWNFIKPYIPIGWKAFRKLLKAIRFEGVAINIDTAKEDAYESAMFYGKLQAALFNVLAVLAGIFTLRVKEANVNCFFNEKRLDAEGEVTVRVRPSTMIHIAFCMVIKALTVLIPQLWRRRRKKKQARKDAEKAQNENRENEGRQEDNAA
ncbi:MAG: hypothetical protein IJ806_10900 [Ruminococcus sp.]|nr:hypothetical protein [Ruminococcus sp.]